MALRGGNSQRNTSLREQKHIYIRKRKRQEPFLMIHQQLFKVLLHVSPSSFPLLPSFCQISSAGPPWACSLASRLRYSPKAGAPLSSSSVYSPTLACLLPSWGTEVFPPSCHLRRPHLVSFLFPSSLLASKDQAHASALYCSSSQKEKRVQTKTFHWRNWVS